MEKSARAVLKTRALFRFHIEPIEERYCFRPAAPSANQGNTKKMRSMPKHARNAHGLPADAVRPKLYIKRGSGFGRTPPDCHVSDLSSHGGITVTDSQGFSPYSMYRFCGRSWHDIDLHIDHITGEWICKEDFQRLPGSSVPAAV